MSPAIDSSSDLAITCPSGRGNPLCKMRGGDPCSSPVRNKHARVPWWPRRRRKETRKRRWMQATMGLPRRRQFKLLFEGVTVHWCLCRLRVTKSSVPRKRVGVHNLRCDSPLTLNSHPLGLHYGRRRLVSLRTKKRKATPANLSVTILMPYYLSRELVRLRTPYAVPGILPSPRDDDVLFTGWVTGRGDSFIGKH